MTVVSPLNRLVWLQPPVSQTGARQSRTEKTQEFPTTFAIFRCCWRLI